jgi:hypothetical protein
LKKICRTTVIIICLCLQNKVGFVFQNSQLKLGKYSLMLLFAKINVCLFFQERQRDIPNGHGKRCKPGTVLFHSKIFHSNHFIVATFNSNHFIVATFNSNHFIVATFHSNHFIVDSFHSNRFIVY